MIIIKTLYDGGSTWGGKKGAGYSMITTMTMIRNGVMTQQSCEQSDAHDVFFPSGFFVKPVWNRSHFSATATVLAPSSGEEPTSPRHRAGVASMAWRTTQ